MTINSNPVRANTASRTPRFVLKSIPLALLALGGFGTSLPTLAAPTCSGPAITVGADESCTTVSLDDGASVSIAPGGTIAASAAGSNHHAILVSGTAANRIVIETNGTIAGVAGADAMSYATILITASPSGSSVGSVALIENSGELSNPSVVSSGTAFAIDNAGHVGRILNHQDGAISGIMNREITVGGQTYAGAIDVIDNDGSLLSPANAAIDNAGHGRIGTINNAGDIMAIDHQAILNEAGATIGTINNTNSIRAIRKTDAILNNGTIGTISNSGTINGAANAGINNSGTIAAIDNSGTITSTARSSLVNTGTIVTLTNTGTLHAGSAGYGISNGSGFGTAGRIGTFNNGGTVTYGAAGGVAAVLPNNYNVLITSPTQYGKLVAPNGSAGSTRFGFTVGAGPHSQYFGSYADVLKGVSASSLGYSGSKYTGVFSGYKYEMNQTAAQQWTLKLLSYVGETAAINRSIAALAGPLRNLYSMQETSLAFALETDCARFDERDLCLGGGSRYSETGSDTTETAAQLFAAYRLNEQTRVGGWVDQGVGLRLPGGVDVNSGSPLFGLFLNWTAAPADGTGLSLRGAVGYGKRTMTLTRPSIEETEPGSGSTPLATQGALLRVSYGFPLAGRWSMQPSVALRHTVIGSQVYQERSSDRVTLPLGVGAITQRATTLIAGLRAGGPLDDRFFVRAELGVEQDLSRNNPSIQASGIAGVGPVALDSAKHRTRPLASAAIAFRPDKIQEVSFDLAYRQAAVEARNTVTAQLRYTLSF